MRPYRERYILDVDYRWVDAVFLEDMSDETTWKAKYLVHKDWDKAYVLNARPDWTEDRYFREAEERIRALNGL